MYQEINGKLLKQKPNNTPKIIVSINIKDMLFFQTSAKEGTNVELAFFKLTEEMSKKEYSEMDEQNNNSYFEDPPESDKESSCCN